MSSVVVVDQDDRNYTQALYKTNKKQQYEHKRHHLGDIPITQWPITINDTLYSTYTRLVLNYPRYNALGDNVNVSATWAMNR